MKEFTDFAEEKILEGEKIKISSILNQAIIITGYSIKNSKYKKNRSGKYLTLQVQMDGEKHVVFTGSDVLIEQLDKYGDMIPFKTTIRKIKRYYSLT